jgi:O-antigen/teichoic acid export membrane protein
MTAAEKESVGARAKDPAPLGAAAEHPGGSALRRSGGQALSELLRSLLALRKSAPALLAFRASAWSVAGYGVSTALRFVSRLALAKFLHDSSPMGDVAIIVVILAGLEMISDLGIGVNIVQHKSGDDRTFLGTAFSVQAIRGVGIWALASLLAAPVGWIYHDPELIGLLLFGALSTLIKAFANPGIWILTRRVDLKGPTLLGVTSEVAGFIVTIIWAILSPSAWAIVGGTVATATIYSVGSHLLGIRVKFAWDGKIARQIAHFGGWMILSSGTYFLSSRGETLMLRGSIPDAQFGCFAFASMLVSTPVSAITQLASQVFLPTLASKIRESPEQAVKHFARAKWVFTATALCFAWGGMILGPPLVRLLGLSGSFVGLGWMVQMLGLRAALDIHCSPTSLSLLASGASRYSAVANIVRLIVLVVGLFVTLKFWGFQEAVILLVAAPLMSYLALFPGLAKHVPGSLRVEAATLALFLVGIALAIAAAWTIAPLTLQ